MPLPPPPLSYDEVESLGTNSGSRLSISVTASLGVPSPSDQSQSTALCSDTSRLPCCSSLSPACMSHFGAYDESLISTAAPPSFFPLCPPSRQPLHPSNLLYSWPEQLDIDKCMTQSKTGTNIHVNYVSKCTYSPLPPLSVCE